jgi:iron(III) transport system substrate-binding protein
MRAAVLALIAALVLGFAGPNAAGADPDAFAALVTAAKAEGSVVINGPPLDASRVALTQGFEHAYGIPVTYISASADAMGARVRAERAAGKYLLDGFVAGVDVPVLTFLPNGWLDRVEPALVEPDVVNPRNWVDGHLWYEDPQHTILRVARISSAELAINTSLVKPREVATWQSLLDPKWQGKIIAKDPTTDGAGAILVSYFYGNLGPDFVRKLYIDQKPTISRDPRQAVQWLAQGNGAILVGPDLPTLYQFQKLGYPVTALFPQGPQLISGGYGLVGLMNHAPHPNAAKLFVNWLASKPGQDAFSNALLEPSLRTDVTYQNVPQILFPLKNRPYFDFYDYKFVTEKWNATLQQARALLQQ